MKHKKSMSIQIFNKTNYICTCHQFLKRDLVFDKDNELLSNGKLTVGCEIFYYYGTINTVSLSKNNNINKSLGESLNDIAIMLESRMFTDCVLKVGYSKINVHKNILASRSKVFNSMLAGKHYKYNPYIIKINGFRPKVVKEMVIFMYTGKSPNIKMLAREMLEIGEKYKLQRLKVMAEESLLHNLSIENACEYLILSELHSAEILKEWCLQFICLNAEKVFNTEKWKVVLNDHPLLVAKLFNIAVNID
uniref:BTB domain-containing protein n=1 Tax=Strongyloides papillosus TaxID=174720 RepID=A0A0N5C1Y8_STREA